MPSRRLALALSLAGTLLPLPALASAAPPRGFVEVTSSDLFSLAGAQSHGSVDCPAGTVPLGGGVGAAVFTGLTVNSTYPTATGWAADVNNPDAASSFFDVTVTCAQRPRGYEIFTTPSSVVPAGRQASAIAVCPGRTKPLGGGVFSSSGLLSVNLADSYPLRGQWNVAENNASTFDTQITAYAVCGKVRGYDLVRGQLSTLNPGITLGGVSCQAPDTQVAIGGGVFTNSTDPRVTVAGTFWESNSWATDLRNGDVSGVLFQPFVVCAG
jgi:hypothetical protein